MGESNFQKHYEEIRERDIQRGKDQPMPKPDPEMSMWLKFGYLISLASIIVSLVNPYGYFASIAAIPLSIIGFIKDRSFHAVIAIIFSLIGIYLCLGMDFDRTPFLVLFRFI